ncbi:sulfite exporter TauE/SafE family protein [Malaciobacter mytili]|uniref:Beta-carotene 15,15'-monooxygenase n=1 Tax=Malaciobacter mytili LMG 24559 TaxID=1032238 RepID=A0AAX2AJK7_9BACT|nr:sulfite exporter TauE/SafE family protein [Malaciobacter mytili]AXH15137.1 sulfite exporter TauE/SafE family protein (DsbD_2 domain) [Malaciobacter mytili LMG 24559]RXI44380.1 beta-carotene 15,15'-monooxygenase [Malaciobacter mytili]RXK15646.1 beta-carotene 15,15'-monooxygenase [Malaciobacter mytili LMG 24559]
METVSIITIITIAFLGSFGHCVGMCGGIVVAYSSTKVKSGWSKQLQALSHILYSFGRITTYVILGFIFGYVGGVVTFDNFTSGILLLTTGTLMVLVGLSLSGKIKFLTNLEHSVSKSPWYQKSFKALIGSDSLLSFYLLGMLNGLLPCGFVYVFAITAASTGSPLWGAFVMLIFGLSTLPALFSLGFFVSIFKQTALRSTIIKIASLVVIGFGVYIAYLGYEYIVDPNKTILSCHI